MLLYIAVLLDDRAGDLQAFDESLVTAGAIIAAETLGENWELWWAKAHALHSTRKDDGSLVESAGEMLRAKFQIARLITVARPLPEITDASKLDTLITTVLDEVLRNPGDAQAT